MLISMSLDKMDFVEQFNTRGLERGEQGLGGCGRSGRKRINEEIAIEEKKV